MTHNEVQVADIVIGTSYEEFTIEELKEKAIEWIHTQKEPVEISRWVIYCEGGYDEGAILTMAFYRLETDAEVIERESKERIATQERIEMEQQRLKNQEQYERKLLAELKAKYKNS